MFDYKSAKDKVAEGMMQHRIDVAGLELQTAHDQIVNFEKWMICTLMEAQANMLEECIPWIEKSEKASMRRLMRGLRDDAAKLKGKR